MKILRLFSMVAVLLVSSAMLFAEPPVLNADQKARLDWAVGALQADKAYVTDSEYQLELNEGFVPAVTPMLVIQKSGFEPVAWPVYGVLDHDHYVSWIVNEFAARFGVSNNPPLAYNKPKPPEAPEAVKIGYEYPKGSGFCVAQGGQQNYKVGQQILYVPAVVKGGYCGPGVYERAERKLNPTPFSTALQGWIIVKQ